MNTENKVGNGRGQQIWSWIFIVTGGLFTGAGLTLIVVSIIDPPTGGDGLFVILYLCPGAGLLLIGPLLLLIGTLIISRKKV
jgi:hypothetical protein